MCGIIGYIGHRPAIPVVMEGLERLEYRGYDSAGVAWLDRTNLNIVRAEGKLRNLEQKLSCLPAIFATCAMGHTRWATHGAPVERNAHPHYSNDCSLAMVHNGIIENFHQLKEKLIQQGYVFHSDTDTEVLVNLIAEKRKSAPDLPHAFSAALAEAHGAYAVCLMAAETPNQLYCARMAAPLVIGVGAGEMFVASDIPAFLPYSREVVFLEDGEMACLTCDSCDIFKVGSLDKVERAKQLIQWDMQAARKDGYRHFMLKEIFEQPRVIKDALIGRIKDNAQILLPELDDALVPERLHIVACGTSWHSGLWARDIFAEFADVPVQVEIASEFRYRKNPLLGPRDAALFISQSGETADTLAALRLVREKGVLSIGLCNVVGSSVAREADKVIFTQAGPEISVASTKAMISQLASLFLMALYWGQRKGLNEEKRKKIIASLRELPALLDANLPAMREKARDVGRAYSGFHNFFFLGRGQCYPLALEGALKLKEISYIHAEGYAAGEMKHGPIALVDPQFPSFVLVLDDDLYPKMKSNIEEVAARGGKVICLGNNLEALKADYLWEIPRVDNPVAAFVLLPALQLFSYEVADYLGKDVDQPRNLAKSVTVE